ncbi:ATP-grasp domain-containing protein [Candidatus Parcubacteria bacterium]|nr:ATP-grasp domain-containing protein [Candidatus Parcubacteria bacterium]
MKTKNIILFVGNVPNRYIEAIGGVGKKINLDLEVAVVMDFNAQLLLSSKNKEKINYLIKCDIENEKQIKKKLEKIKKQVVAVILVFENFATLYCNVLKIIKLQNNPPADSIEKGVDKSKMRKAFLKYDSKITPKFMLVKNRNSVDLISNKIGFPCILKPAHLDRSKLVTVSNNLKELKENLNRTFTVIDKIYKKENRYYKPIVLAEEFMNGKMYSVDAYINRDQKIYLTPFICEIQAKEVGIDDFHIHTRIVPSDLNKQDIRDASLAARKSILAIGLRNIAAHIELIKTRNGWKIVEIGPRLGAYRNIMLDLSYGIKHIENYLSVRLGKKPIIKKKIVSYSAVAEFFPEKEGRLKSIVGINKVKKLDSFFSLVVKNKTGEKVGLAKDGYLHTLRITLNNTNKKTFYEDLESIRDIIKIKVK